MAGSYNQSSNSSSRSPLFSRVTRVTTNVPSQLSTIKTENNHDHSTFDRNNLTDVFNSTGYEAKGARGGSGGSGIGSAGQRTKPLSMGSLVAGLGLAAAFMT